jgi:hypothetical protein
MIRSSFDGSQTLTIDADRREGPGDLIMVAGQPCIRMADEEPKTFLCFMLENGLTTPWCSDRIWVDGPLSRRPWLYGGQRPIAIIRCRQKGQLQVLLSGRIVVNEEQAARAECFGWERVRSLPDSGLVEIER